MKISLIIPMYNEAKIIENSVRTVGEFFTANFAETEWEVLYISDGSRDNCRQLAQNAAQKYPQIKVLGYEINRGKGGAVRYGMDMAQGDIIFFTDCDLAYGVEVIKSAYITFCHAKESSGAKILIGSRRISKDGYKNYNFLRKLMSKTYHKVVNIAAGFHHSDSQCGFKAFTKEAAGQIFSRCKINGFAFDLEALIIGEHLGFKVIEFPVKIINHNDSSVHPVRDTYRMLRDVKRIKKSVRQMVREGILPIKSK